MKTIRPGTRRIIPAAVASALASFTVALATCAIAHDANAGGPASDGDNANTSVTVATAKLFDRVADQPAKLRIFLQAMPKGGDLHNHLAGSPYAEDYLKWAAADGSCISRSKRAVVAAPCSAPGLTPARDLATRDPSLYAFMIDALSLHGHNQGVGVNDVSGHDLFFSTFGRFDAVASIQPGKSIAAVQEMAAGDHVSYVELIYNPAIVDQTSLTTSDPQFDAADFAGALKRFAPEMPALIRTGRAQVDRAESDAQAALGCKQQSAGASAACNVKIHYQGYAIRALPPAQVFRELALCFALADADKRFVGVNIVAPEDGPVAVRDYALHMRMFQFFEQRYPNVKTTLHAGELTLGIVPPAALRDHIRQAVEIGGAKRIGHGVDIMYETDAPGLLARMARDHIAVEINLTSNDRILHVTGAQHPLAVYRAAGVPVVISTDDEGVTRTDMTNEYQRAATEQKLRYTDLKEIARASLEYSFLPGNGIWSDNKIGMLMASCKDDPAANANGAAPTPQDACTTYLAGSEKAQAEWRLEQEFRLFEQKIGTQVF